VLRRHVARKSADRFEAGSRRHVDDRSTPAREHCRDLELHREKHAAQGEPDRRVVRFDREVDQLRGCLAAAGRVVARQVEAAELADRSLDHTLDRVRVADVGRHHERPAAAFLDDARDTLQRRFVAGRQRHGSARLGERPRGRRPDAAARTGDERDLSIEESFAHRRLLALDAMRVMFLVDDISNGGLLALGSEQVV
jgi:hypothetical protein